MNFEWDEKKSESNRLKHGIDFQAAKNLWLDDHRVEIRAPYPLEDRNIIIAEYENRLWTAIFTMRGETIRMISVRRARIKEVALYEEEGAG
jgi:uncharacterized DUF497 family protein